MVSSLTQLTAILLRDGASQEKHTTVRFVYKLSIDVFVVSGVDNIF